MDAVESRISNVRLWPCIVRELMTSVGKEVGGKLHHMRKYAPDLINHTLLRLNKS